MIGERRFRKLDVQLPFDRDEDCFDPYRDDDWLERDLNFHDDSDPHDGRRSRQTDIAGQPVKYTKDERPYDYSCFVVWRKHAPREGNGNGYGVYSDRLRQADPDKYQSAFAKHLANAGFSEAQPRRVQEFLREYYSDPKLELLVILEGCNRSTGYPVWTFHFKSTNQGTE